MKIAIKEGRTIITYDSDYGELIFKHGYKPYAGVILFVNNPLILWKQQKSWKK